MADEQEIINTLTQRLQYGECVLFLGPDILTNAQGVPVTNAFSALLYEEIRNNQIEFDDKQKENIYYTTGRYIKGVNEAVGFQKETEHSLKRKYGQFLQQQAVYGDIFQQLASLPFYLTINTNPDRHIHTAFQKNAAGRKYHFGYYDYTRKDNETMTAQHLPVEIDSENAVVYNVYGLNDPEKIRSLIISEAHFIEFTRTVNLAGNGMPNTIKNFISGGRICLFIGFRYNQWPLKLLLTALGFSKDVPEQNVSLLYDSPSPHHFHFYRDELKFAFLHTRYHEFIRQLYESFTAAVQKPGTEIKKTPSRPVHIVYISDIDDNEEAKKDRKIRDKIAGQLKPLEQSAFISQWSESNRDAGSDRVQVLKEQYGQADIFVVIASGQLSGSEYFSRIETAALAIAGSGHKKIIPVYARFCLYKEYPFREDEWVPFNNGQAPEAIASGNDSDEDQKIMAVAKYIQACAFGILQQRN